MSMDPGVLRNRVRDARDRLGWSQAELAARSGLSRSGVSAIEQGRLIPSTAAAIARSIEEGVTTPDIGGSATTAEVTRFLVETSTRETVGRPRG